MKKIISIILVTSLILVGCVPLDTDSGGNPVQNTEDNKDNKDNKDISGVTENIADSEKITNTSIEIFKESIESKENSLVSPLSVLMAMGMTTNGASGDTLTEIEEAFGMTRDQLNEFFKAYKDKDILNIANSIWLRDNDILVEESFVKTNKETYGAQVSHLKFDEEAVKKINNWVSENTNGMIDGIIEEINANSLMYLINALAFEGKWEEAYETGKIYEGYFTSINNDKQDVEMMGSKENIYLSDEKVKGFIKPYEGDYSFVALLPNEDINIEEYIKDMTGKELTKLIAESQAVDVAVEMPKFSYDYSVKMNGALKNLGIVVAFDSKLADFSKIASAPDNIYIGDVLHKTFIEVDEVGTKAAAVTSVEMKLTSVVVEDDTYSVKLDRPFIYGIIDNKANIPVFLGTVMDLGE